MKARCQACSLGFRMISYSRYRPGTANNDVITDGDIVK